MAIFTITILIIIENIVNKIIYFIKLSFTFLIEFFNVLFYIFIYILALEHDIILFIYIIGNKIILDLILFNEEIERRYKYFIMKYL